MKTHLLRAALWSIALIGVSSAPVLRASTVWIDWTSASAGEPGSASGTLDGATVSFSGEVLANTVINGTTGDWSNPASSFIGGTVTASPSSVGDIITEDGTYSGTDTITFNSPIIDPLIAIWSLGSESNPATYTFDATPTFEAGGPDSYGGGPITVSGDVVSGIEGSGVVQFTGTFSSLSWTTAPEHYYGFTVGENGGVAPVSSAPEPSSLALCGACFLLIALMAAFRKKRA